MIEGFEDFKRVAIRLLHNPERVYFRFIDAVLTSWPINSLKMKTIEGEVALKPAKKEWQKKNFEVVRDFYHKEHRLNLESTSRPFFDKIELLNEAHNGVEYFSINELSYYQTRLFRLMESSGTPIINSDLYFRKGLFPVGALKAFKLKKVFTTPGHLIIGHGTSGYNYYHFLHEIFAQVLLLIECEVIKPGDRVFWMSADKPYQKELQSILESEYDLRFEPVELYSKYHFSNVTIASRVVGHSFHYQQLLTLIDRQVPLSQVNCAPPFLIIRRKADAQRFSEVIDGLILKTAELCEVQVCYMEDFSVSEQKCLWKSASIVVAQHGASLANICFCSKGAAVIELFQRNYTQICYASMADEMELDYRPYVVESDEDCGKVLDQVKKYLARD
jgi:hypothetical protein